MYGIAADATNREAILATFRLKQRPAENPLIVHVAGLEDAIDLVTAIPPSARKLAERFWPGPLTLVLPKSDKVPSEATAGQDTVAIRVPGHPTALAILKQAGIPLTAPSANTFMGLSPTAAELIQPEILAGLECVIDGGPCDVGVESTVVDCRGPSVSVLRPGGVSRMALEKALGIAIPFSGTAEHRSPGRYMRHYSPRTPLRLVEKLEPHMAGIGFDPPQNKGQIQMSRDPRRYARELYFSLIQLDARYWNELFAEMPPDEPEWEAVRDRLLKAAHD